MQSFLLMAQTFWRMVPAAAAARELGMNSKTLQKYYDIMRQAICGENEKQAMEQFGSASVDPALFRGTRASATPGTGPEPLLCLAERNGRLYVLFPRIGHDGESASVGAAEIAGWVCARDRLALHSLDLDRTRFFPAAGVAGNGAHHPFWGYAKKGMVGYHGGFRKNFRFFVREMEFRFNNGKGEGVLPWLVDILRENRKGNSPDIAGSEPGGTGASIPLQGGDPWRADSKAR